MKKIKYQGGLTKFLTSRIGQMNKARFANLIEENLRAIRCQFMGKTTPLSLASFSCSNDFYDQTLSILSFLRYVGTPVSWIIYSDGTHTPQQIQLLKWGFEFVVVIKEDWEDPGSVKTIKKKSLLPYKDHLMDFAKKIPLGKKLFYYLNHEINQPTLFLDADILFYSHACFFDIIIQDKINGWYLPDSEWGCLDSRYKEKHSKQMYQANSGFFLINQEIENVKEGLDFLKSLGYKYEYFSEQNIFHILFRSNGFLPLDSRIFIINSDDQFDFSYQYKRESIAIRHYTGPVRHKMWQRDWKWQLSL